MVYIFLWFVETNMMKFVFRFLDCKPNCNAPGSGCYDPRFIGGDGRVFYFHGKVTNISVQPLIPSFKSMLASLDIGLQAEPVIILGFKPLESSSTPKPSHLRHSNGMNRLTISSLPIVETIQFQLKTLFPLGIP